MPCICAQNSRRPTRVYFVRRNGRFIVIDYEDDPAQGEWVMTEEASDDGIVIETYRDQPYYGVVVWLEDWWNVNSRRYADAK